MTEINKNGIWYTWNDATGEEIAVRVFVIESFIEEGDSIPGLNMIAAQDYEIGYGVQKMGTTINGIDSRDVIVVN